MIKDLSVPAVVMGLLAAFTGFAGSFAIALQGLLGAGATSEQAATGLMALSLSMGLCGIYLSVRTRMPISVAWSTPGAALLATSGSIEGGFAAAVGGFVLCGLMLTFSGAWPALTKAVSKIPATLASAMLAGVLLDLCLAPVRAVVEFPVYGLLLCASWILVGSFNKLAAVPAALLVFIIIMVFGIELPQDVGAQLLSSVFTKPEVVVPSINFSAITGTAIPLFIVTMASQNIPGIAILQSRNYHPEPGFLIATTGVFSTMSSFFGGHAVNLAAITAALCAGEDANQNPAKRYWAAIVAGLAYVLFGIFAGVVTMAVSFAPPVLLQAVAGLALVSVFSSSIVSAFAVVEDREASAITFFTTVSGLSFAGISGAFWGLLVGGFVYVLKKQISKKK